MSSQLTSAVPLVAGKISLKQSKLVNTPSVGVSPVTPVVPVSPPFTCFLAGSTVLMEDGTIKAIELVEAGEYVVGAFGEINEVLALDRTMLGDRPMYRINGDHSTTAEHPHVGVDRKFYAQDTEATYNEYGTEHKCLVHGDRIETLVLHGIKAGKVSSMKIGVKLQTTSGSKEVETIEKYKLPASTLLYNLVLSGSHTYFVDGYAVGGWLRDDDFDYDTWTTLDVPKINITTYNESRNTRIETIM